MTMMGGSILGFYGLIKDEKKWGYRGYGSSRGRQIVSVNRTSCDYWDHNPQDFDCYVRNPTIADLPVLLDKFDNEGLEVWPWIWTHPNEDGPHHVFVGVNEHIVQQIQELRKASPQNNILVIASQDSLQKAAKGHLEIYDECHCGLVTDAQMQLLHHEAKILMLSDERVIAFDFLTIS